MHAGPSHIFIEYVWFHLYHSYSVHFTFQLCTNYVLCDRHDTGKGTLFIDLITQLIIEIWTFFEDKFLDLFVSVPFAIVVLISWCTRTAEQPAKTKFRSVREYLSKWSNHKLGKNLLVSGTPLEKRKSVMWWVYIHIGTQGIMVADPIIKQIFLGEPIMTFHIIQGHRIIPINHIWVFLFVVTSTAASNDEVARGS